MICIKSSKPLSPLCDTVTCCFAKCNTAITVKHTKLLNENIFTQRNIANQQTINTVNLALQYVQQACVLRVSVFALKSNIQHEKRDSFTTAST